MMTLGKTLFFKGELAADEDLLLLGRVEGSIVHTENLTIGNSGIVKGDLRARTVTVKGTVDGDIEASESVTVTPTANVMGDIVAPRVSIIEGAKFNGNVKMLPAAREARRTDATDIVASKEPLEPAAEQKLLGA
jgi:cytoskeletal protein CcmA (bactofilin family)